MTRQVTHQNSRNSHLKMPMKNAAIGLRLRADLRRAGLALRGLRLGAGFFFGCGFVYYIGHFSPFLLFAIFTVSTEGA